MTKKHVPTKNRSWRPTPQEIRQACQLIQANWTDAERQKRSGETDVSVSMPTFEDCQFRVHQPILDK